MSDHRSPRRGECSISKVTEPGETSPDSSPVISAREDRAALLYQTIQHSRIGFASAPVSLNKAADRVGLVVATNTPIRRRHTVDVYQSVESSPGC